jgi:hypothetical protein
VRGRSQRHQSTGIDPYPPASIQAQVLDPIEDGQGSQVPHGAGTHVAQGQGVNRGHAEEGFITRVERFEKPHEARREAALPIVLVAKPQTGDGGHWREPGGPVASQQLRGLLLQGPPARATPIGQPGRLTLQADERGTGLR